MIAEVNPEDPGIAVITWVLTGLAGKFGMPEEHRWALPYVALAFASFLVALSEWSKSGDPFSPEVLVRGLGAGAAAIAGNSVYNGTKTGMERTPPEEEK